MRLPAPLVSLTPAGTRGVQPLLPGAQHWRAALAVMTATLLKRKTPGVVVVVVMQRVLIQEIMTTAGNMLHRLGPLRRGWCPEQEGGAGVAHEEEEQPQLQLHHKPH